MLSVSISSEDLKLLVGLDAMLLYAGKTLKFECINQ